MGANFKLTGIDLISDSESQGHICYYNRECKKEKKILEGDVPARLVFFFYINSLSDFMQPSISYEPGLERSGQTSGQQSPLC